MAESLEGHAQSSEDRSPDRRRSQRRSGRDRRGRRRAVFDRRCGFDRRSHPFYAPRRPPLCVSVTGPWDLDDDRDDLPVPGVLSEIEDAYAELLQKRPGESGSRLWREAAHRVFDRYEPL